MPGISQPTAGRIGAAICRGPTSPDPRARPKPEPEEGGHDEGDDPETTKAIESRQIDLAISAIQSK